VWVYLGIMTLNLMTGFLEIWFFDGARFVVYGGILATYAFTIHYMNNESRPFRDYNEIDGDMRENFYFKAGMEHMFKNAREQWEDTQSRLK